MREIKFRVWDKENGCFFEPTYEAYKGKLEFLKLGMNGRLSMMELRGLVDESLFPDRFELNQYTGLKDKNGKEIYEGDIVKIQYEDITCLKNKEAIGDVCWDEETASWFIENYDYTFFYGEKEVIGNIYENLELIEYK